MPRPAPSVERVLALLNLLGENPGEYLTLSEVARRLDLNKATAHGILAVLADCSYILRQSEDSGYTLGPAWTTIGRAALARQYEIARVARLEMEELAAAARGLCVVTALSGDQIFVIAQTGTPSGLTDIERGLHAPLVPPHGLVFAAWASESELNKWLTAVPLSEAEVHSVHRSLDLIRERGFSVTLSAPHYGELRQQLRSVMQRINSRPLLSALREVALEVLSEDDEIRDLQPGRNYSVASIAAPVFDSDGTVKLGLALTAVPDPTGAEVRDLGYAVTAAAARITRQLNGAQPAAAAEPQSAAAVNREQMTRFSPAAARVVRLLNFLAAHPGESFRLSEVARRLDFNKATAHGMLATMTDGDYLTYDAEDKTFSLGPAVVTLSCAAVKEDEKVALFASQEMESLAKSVRAQVVMNVEAGEDMVVIASAGEPAAGGRGTRVGYRVRSVPPLGMIFHAWASMARVDRWLDRIRADAKERARYRTLLSVVAERGFSLAADEEMRERLDTVLDGLQGASEATARTTLREVIADFARGEHELVEIVEDRTYRIRQISAPVTDAEGAVRMGLLITGLPPLSGRALLDCADQLVASARRISVLLAGRDPYAEGSTTSHDSQTPMAPARAVR
jgi:DNA-binding IclR family transcriptional regulator